ncbi:MAG TPA: C25 family cysteine peptidase [Holophaga sp.]|nr:C25 family cysteine peptidase [Holophaga sp.]
MTRPSPRLKRPWLALGALAGLLACGGGGGGGQEHPGTLQLTRLETTAPGLVRLPYASLASAGLATGDLKVASLRLTNQGATLPLATTNADGATFKAGDALEFYAPGMDSAYTGINVFWLDQGAGRSMPTRAAAPGAGTPATVLTNTLHVEENHTLWGLTPGLPDADPWFWAKLTAPATRSLPFTLPGLDAGAATLKVRIQGKSSTGPSPDHHVAVALNGVALGDLRWTGTAATVQPLDIPPGVLAAGANTLVLTLPGDTGAVVDQVLLDWFEVTYPRPLAASSGALGFAVPGGAAGPVKVAGLPAGDLRLLDITDPAAPVALRGFTTAQEGTARSLLFQDGASAAARSYLAVAASAAQAPAKVEGRGLGALRAGTNGADWILVAPRAFLAAAEPLRALRQSQGLRARTVAVEDVYDEFGYGLPTPEALKAFLAYARASWTAPAPTYVVLLGDATYDPRDRMGTGKASQVPCHLSVTEQLGLTPDDNWYAALDGTSEFPVLRIGRLPSASATQAAQVVAKLVAYENAAAPPARALLVADNVEPDFQAMAEAAAGLLPAAASPVKVYLSQYADFAKASQDIVSAFNQGACLTLYAGHGDVADWAGEMVLNNAKVPLLTNGGVLPFSVMFNCLNGFFAMPGSYSLAETLVASPAGGAVAAYASSGLGFVWEQDLLVRRLMPLLFRADRPTLGEACTQARVLAVQDGASLDLIRTFTLIGDPAMRLKLPL